MTFYVVKRKPYLNEQKSYRNEGADELKKIIDSFIEWNIGKIFYLLFPLFMRKGNHKCTSFDVCSY